MHTHQTDFSKGSVYKNIFFIFEYTKNNRVARVFWTLGTRLRHVLSFFL